MSRRNKEVTIQKLNFKNANLRAIELLKENFPKNEIDEYLNSIGLSIGADFNASTGFERTIYTLDIPTNKVDDLEKGIHILADISSNATLSDAAFEKERKII